MNVCQFLYIFTFQVYLLKDIQQLHVAQSNEDDILGVTVGSQKAHAQVLVDP